MSLFSLEKVEAQRMYTGANSFTGMDSSQRDSAIRILSARHFKKPSNTQFIRELAEAYTADNNSDSAQYYWGQLLALQPDNDTVYYSRALIYYDKNKWDSASSALAHAISLRPANVDYTYLQALIDYRTGRRDSSLDLCGKILSQDPSDINALMLSGIILRDEGRHDMAFEKFDKCIKTDPANTEALIHRAEEYVFLRKYTDALRDYSAARADLSANADNLNNIGICYYQSGSYRQAISFFKKAMAINRYHPQSYFNAGLSYYYTDHLDTASADIKKAESIWDTCHADTCRMCFLDAVYYMGMCYKRSGDLQAAKQHFIWLQKELYPKDLSTDIRYIDYALFISRNWYYVLGLSILLIVFIVFLYRVLKR